MSNNKNVLKINKNSVENETENKTENTQQSPSLSELLSEVLKHRDLPKNLKVNLWNTVNKSDEFREDASLEQIRVMLNIPKNEDERRAEYERENQRQLDLLKSLDDRMTAQNFTDKKFAQAKDLFAQTLMAVGGVPVNCQETIEWVVGNFLELLEIFMICHDNFDREQLAENLQSYLYTWTMEYGDVLGSWKKSVFVERGFDSNGIELEPEIETEPVTATAA